jgi:hypothetical protein
MLIKLGIALFGLVVISKLDSKTIVGLQDKYYAQTFFILMTGYFLITSSLYLVSLPLAESVSELPSKMAYILMRLLTAFLLLTLIHLNQGFAIEMDR